MNRSELKEIVSEVLLRVLLLCWRRCLAVLQSFRDKYALRELLKRVCACDLGQLDRLVLIDELVNVQVAAAGTYQKFVVFDFDCDSLGAEHICALALAHEHDFQLFSIREIVDVVSHLQVDGIILHRQVDRGFLFEVKDNVLKSGSLDFPFSHDLECVQASLIRVEHPRLEIVHVVGELQILVHRFFHLSADFSKLDLERLVLLG